MDLETSWVGKQRQCAKGVECQELLDVNVLGPKGFIKWQGHNSIQRTFTGTDFVLSRQMKLWDSLSKPLL